MANVISSFLVGVGFDYDKRGADKIESSMDGIRSRALQVGSVVAGAFGIKALTADFAASNDALGKWSDTFGMLPSDVFALGQAIEHEGGSIDGLMSQLEGLARMQAGLLQGDTEWIAAASRAGIDTAGIENASSAIEAYLSLADQFQGMSTAQRLNAAQALGLDEASIRLLSKGRAEVSANMATMRGIRDVTGEMTTEAARFNDGVQDLMNSAGSFADQVSMAILPGINDTVEATNSWIAANKELLSQNLDSALKPIAENFNTIAAAGSLLVAGGMLKGLAGMAQYVPIIGKALAVAATAAGRLTVIGAGVTVGASIWDWDAETVKEKTGLDLPDWLFKPMGELFDDSGEAVRGKTSDDVFDVGDLPSTDSMQSIDDYPDLPSLGSVSPRMGGASSGRTQRDISINMMLDGQVLDRRTLRVMSEQGELTIDELSTTVVG